ncbi:uncharacterized protein SPAPADRAFT_70602 [Spathaspora passalidarum NRRL Y-27907]|uniref:Uncharacterized protein n=1 Tax=Spathaspora passalidarum (strain NRRL Y-27907 / 11-Y1) TaxID=619300 RepID=G3AIT2_SPAPN|nr:uncharacterized protein SPAPADRAFT_70602 [Spathaspora passalidarum NRRL Y-27907]EGW34498.1 hypothetical protein SPAPADRAFT_70602 [Spathaspora passalidarum NRRL Y-27907]
MTGAIYICIKQFNARLGDELSLKVGDKVEVIADDSEYNDGWYMGKNLLTNEVGLYPNSFTQLLVPEESEGELLRSRSRSRHVGASTATAAAAASGPPPTGLGIIGANTTPTIAEHDDHEPIMVDAFDKLNINAKMNANTSHNNLNSEIDKALKEIKDGHPSPDNTILSKESITFSTSTSNHDDVGILDPSQAISWSPKEVAVHFMRRGFDSDISNKFVQHKITGDILFQLELAHLKELDINSFGTRFEVNKEIERLKGLIKKPKLESRTNSQSTSSTHKDTNSFYSPPSAATTLITEERADEFAKPKPIIEQQQNQHQEQLMPSVMLSPSETTFKSHKKSKSQSLDDLTKPPTPAYTPRKAPEPPTSNGNSPMGSTFRFGAGSEDLRSPSGSYMTRTAASERPSSSLYDSGSAYHKRNDSVKRTTSPHKRHSSLFSFLSSDDVGKKKDDLANIPPLNVEDKRAATPATGGTAGTAGTDATDKSSSSPVDIDDASLSPKRKKVLPRIKTKDLFSNNGNNTDSSDEPKSDPTSLSNAMPSTSRLKSFRSSSTQNFRNLTTSKKSKTSAFQEGIREINPEEAIKTANFSGWMSKRSGNTLAWRSRFFTLHGTRLSYFTSLKDNKEKGLIDITAHKVLPISTDSDSDKYKALIASSTLAGSYCFKVVPPAPGFKKGLTFTQPKTHYFAVNTEEEMRGWMKALMTATIDIDDSVPVVSSCSTPTVSLGKAQELLAKAREETKLKDEELRAQGYIRVHDDFEDSVDSTSSSINGTTGTIKRQQKHSSDMNRSMTTPTTPRATSGTGFSSPYMLAGGVISSSKPHTPVHGGPQANSTPPLGNGPMMTTPGSGKKEKLLAYSSDMSGNHTFVIKNKK